MASPKISLLAQVRARARWQLAQAMLGTKARKNARRFAVGVVKVDRLGDFVLAVSAIRILTEKFGAENCLLILSPFAKEIAAREFPSTPQIVLPPFVPKKLRRLVPLWRTHHQEFSGLSCQHLVSLRHSPSLYRDTLFNWVPADQRHGITGPFPFGDFSGGDYPFARKVPYPASAPDCSCLDLECHRLVISSALGREVSTQEVLPRLHSFKTSTGPNLLVAPFSSATIKDYPVPLLLDALRRFQNQRSLPIDVIVGPDQSNLLSGFEQQARATGVTFTSARICASLDDYFETIASAKVILTMDSASAHLAGALDKPVVTLLGGGHGRTFGPWYHSPDRQVWLRREIACQNCNWTCTQPENYCLSRIAPADIASALHRVLATK